MQTSECVELKAAMFRMMELMTDMKKELTDVKSELKKVERRLNTSQDGQEIVERVNKKSHKKPLRSKYKINKNRLTYKSYSHFKNKAKQSRANNDAKSEDESSSSAAALSDIVSAESGKKVKFLFKEVNLLVNILCNKDEKTLRIIQKNMNRPIIALPKLNPGSTQMPQKDLKRKIQKAKRRGVKQTPNDNNAPIVLTPKNSTSTDTGYMSPTQPSSQTYNINDINSNDDTDDEENPKRAIPLWAQEPHLNQLYEKQEKTVKRQDEDYVFKSARQDTKIVIKKPQILGNKSFNN